MIVQGAGVEDGLSPELLSDILDDEDEVETSPEELVAVQQTMDRMIVEPPIQKYIVDVVTATRTPAAVGLETLTPFIDFGASPRASIALFQAARAHAFMRHRGYVSPEDIKAVAPDILRHRIILSYEAEAEGETVEHIVRKILDTKTEKVSLAHGLLAGLNAHEVITTNYDALFERAVKEAGAPVPTVLPWESVQVGRPWLLKLHGDLVRPGSIVLTRRDFVLFDARSRPAGSLLQATLMTKHLLIVGASLADDNVIRLAMEVDDYLDRNQTAVAKQGTFVDVSGQAARQDLWSNQFDWYVCKAPEFNDRIREMEIFLDVVAAYAARNAPWLLDPRFAGLLSTDEQRIVDDVRAALALVPSGDDGLLAPLREVREELGGG